MTTVPSTCGVAVLDGGCSEESCSTGGFVSSGSVGSAGVELTSDYGVEVTSGAVMSSVGGTCVAVGVTVEGEAFCDDAPEVWEEAEEPELLVRDPPLRVKISSMLESIASLYGLSTSLTKSTTLSMYRQ